MKTCLKCQQEKPLEDFNRDRQKRDGRRPYCRECEKGRLRTYSRYVRDPKKKRLATRKFQLKRLGLTFDEYDALFESQGGACAICKKPPADSTTRTLCVDHDHTCCSEPATSCGLCVRGLLCRNCNRGLGYLKDDLVILESALEYLTSWRNAASL